MSSPLPEPPLPLFISVWVVIGMMCALLLEEEEQEETPLHVNHLAAALTMTISVNQE